ncbi:RAD55 family ATPase [Candidatus Altiarchaeota archaeon]
MQDRIKTGIAGLDNILDGGIPKGHTVLVAGSCGTGKTTLCQEFLFSGAREGEVGLYISLSEPREKMIRNMEDFNFYDQELVDAGKVVILDITQDARLKGIGLQNVHGLMNILRTIIQDTGAKRVAIDSITGIGELLADQAKIRDFIFELGYQLSYIDVTMLLISEIPPQVFKYSVFGVEEFISDGVILLTEFERKGELIRALQVVKMRGVNHSRNKYVLKIMDDGVTLIPMFKSGSDD